MKHLTKPIIVFLLLWGYIASLFAQEKKPCVVIWSDYQGKKTEVYSFLLENTPQIEVKGGEVIIYSEGSWDIFYNEYEVDQSDYSYSFSMEYAQYYSMTIEEREYSGNYYYYQEATPVEEVAHEVKAKPNFRINGDKLFINGVAPNTMVQLHDLSGKALTKVQAGTNGSAILQLPHTTGTVIVTTKDINFKILVK